MEARTGAANCYMHICPVCGKKFLPAPQHIYKTSPAGRLVCTYHCMIKYRKEQERKKRELKRKKKDENI